MSCDLIDIVVYSEIDDYMYVFVDSEATYNRLILAPREAFSKYKGPGIYCYRHGDDYCDANIYTVDDFIKDQLLYKMSVLQDEIDKLTSGAIEMEIFKNYCLYKELDEIESANKEQKRKQQRKELYEELKKEFENE
jgi:hypothetical protein